MKPGIPSWATNPTYASGVDAGNQNKYEPSTGRVADGFERGKTLATGWENMHRWRVSQRLDNLAAGRLKNWVVMPDQSAVPVAFGATAAVYGAGCYRPIQSGVNTDYHHLEINDTAGVGAYYNYSSPGGRWWTVAASGLAGTARINSMESDPTGIAGVGVSSAAPSGLYYSLPAAPAAWTVSPGTVGLSVASLDYSTSTTLGHWLAVETTVGDIWTGTSLVTGLANVSGLATVSTACAIRSSNHPAGTLYPQDAGNHCCLYANTTGTWARSIDSAAAVWAALTPAPFVPNICARDALAYSAWGSRWGMLVTNGPGTVLSTFAYSDDNGDNIVEVVDAFGFDARGLVATDDCVLLCDGFGHWVAAFEVDTGAGLVVEQFASTDNGATWFQVYMPWDRTASATAARTRIEGWYGDGAFWLAFFGYNGTSSVLNIAKSTSTGEV